MSQYNRYFAQSLSYYGCIFPKSFDKGNTFADAVSRPSIATIANAMDVGDPSNFARVLAL